MARITHSSAGHCRIGDEGGVRAARMLLLVQDSMIFSRQTYKTGESLAWSVKMEATGRFLTSRGSEAGWTLVSRVHHHSG